MEGTIKQNKKSELKFVNYFGQKLMKNLKKIMNYWFKLLKN